MQIGNEMEDKRYGKMVKGGGRRARNNGSCQKGRKENTVLRNVRHNISYILCSIYSQ